MQNHIIVFSACSFKRQLLHTNPPLAAYSNYLAKRHGYKTRLYTDLKNYKLLKNIEYDEIIFLDEKIIKEFPETGWSLGKILTMSMVNEPFIHIDFDLLLVNDIPKYIKNTPCFLLHNEPHLDCKKSMIQKLYNKYQNLDEINYNFVHSTNCAIFGVNDYKTVNESCKKVLDYTMINNKFLKKYSNLLYSKYDDNNFFALFLEQILLLNIINNKINNLSLIINKKTFSEISREADKLKLFHIWGGKINFLEKFENVAKNKNLKY